MEFRVQRGSNALYLAIQALPHCEEPSLLGELSGIGESYVWLQNMLANQLSSSVFGGSITIGRKPSSHIQLHDRAISGCHGTLTWHVEIVTQSASTAPDVTDHIFNPGDIVSVRITYTDSSSNGSFDSSKPIERGSPYPIFPSLLTIPGRSNALDPVAPPPSQWTTIYLGKAKAMDSTRPVFAFNTSIAISEVLTTNAVYSLSSEQLAAFPYGVKKATFVGCVKDPRLLRMKLELNADKGPEKQPVTNKRNDVSTNGAATEMEDLRRQVAKLQQEVIGAKAEAEKERLEREKESREKMSKRDEADMEIHLLRKKVGALQTQIATVAEEKAKALDDVCRLQENYERAEMKRAQTQALLETTEARMAELETERYKLSVASTQNESRNKILESQLRELERRLHDLEQDTAQMTENLKTEKDRLALENKKLVSEIELIKEQTSQTIAKSQKSLHNYEAQTRKQIKAIIKSEREHHARLMKSLNAFPPPDLTCFVSPTYNPPPTTSTDEEFNALPVIHPTLSDIPQAADDTCSATDDGIDNVSDANFDIATLEPNSESETPLQVPLKENERPKRQPGLAEDSTKRQRYTGDMQQKEDDEDHIFI